MPSIVTLPRLSEGANLWGDFVELDHPTQQAIMECFALLMEQCRETLPHIPLTDKVRLHWYLEVNHA